MSVFYQYILEFNKLMSNKSITLSSKNDVAIKNKLLLIEQNINYDDVDFDSFENMNFFSNIYNILSQSTDPKSSIILICVDFLQKSIHSRNKTIMNIIKEINFLPAVTKLLCTHSVQEDFSEHLIKLLKLINNLILFINELDEHNIRILITSLCDLIENGSNEEATKLSLHILTNIAMLNENAKYLINRSIKTSKVQEKIDQSLDLIAMKFLIISCGEFLSKDFPYLIKLSVKSIIEALKTFDSEPLIHAIDVLKYIKRHLPQMSQFSDVEGITNSFYDLNEQLIQHSKNENLKQIQIEFIEYLFIFYTILMDFDDKFVLKLEKFTSEMFQNLKLTKLASGLEYLSSYISHGGSSSIVENNLESMLDFHNKDDGSISSSQKNEFIKFLKVLCKREKLDNSYRQVLEYMENILSLYDDLKVTSINDDVIFVLVYTLETLSSLSQESNLFANCFDKFLNLQILPYVITKAYLLRNEEIFKILFKLMSIEKFPNAKIAELLSSNENWGLEIMDHKKVKIREATTSSKYITGILLTELDTLIKTIKEKIESDEYEGCKSSDIMMLFQQKNNYLENHLTTVTESLNKLADQYNEVQQQNAVLRKLTSKQEMSMWCLQLEKEKYQKENQKLEKENEYLLASLVNFKGKIDKEILHNYQLQKQLETNTTEIDKLRSEKQKFRQSQMENERRIQELKAHLDEETNLRETEVSKALAELKKTSQKAEREHSKFQEVLKLNEMDLMEKQKRIGELESELKEAEKIQMSIMSIMQKSNKNAK